MGNATLMREVQFVWKSFVIFFEVGNKIKKGFKNYSFFVG